MKLHSATFLNSFSLNLRDSSQCFVSTCRIIGCQDVTVYYVDELSYIVCHPPAGTASSHHSHLESSVHKKVNLLMFVRECAMFVRKNVKWKPNIENSITKNPIGTNHKQTPSSHFQVSGISWEILRTILPSLVFIILMYDSTYYTSEPRMTVNAKLWTRAHL